MPSSASLWVGTSDSTDYPRLTGDLDTEVVVIGGGITGLTTAYLLKRNGIDVVVVEGDRVACGVTGFTTAKITALHGLVYAGLESSFGLDGARTYAEANQAAIELVADICVTNDIECGFVREDAYTYAASSEDVRSVREEAEAAARAGLPASFRAETSLPFHIAGAVRVEGQASFHPRLYCLGLARAISDSGVRIFEQSRARDVREGEKGEPCVVQTESGRIQADHVVLATQLPFLDRGSYFAKTHPESSYAIACRLNSDPPDGMYITAGSPTRSIRRYVDGDDAFLIVGGENHKTGQAESHKERYENLERWARENFDVKSVDYRWSARDYMPVDGVPYIGRLGQRAQRLWTVTGLKKWGMSNGTVGAMILSELIAGRDHPWASFFDSTRVKAPFTSTDLVSENVNVAKRFVGDRLGTLTGPGLDEIAPGQARVIRAEGQRIAAYRDEDGNLYAVSATCTHLGCLVAFNDAEKTWDCPCHGSRFDLQGRVLQGPALEDLESVTVEAKDRPD